MTKDKDVKMPNNINILLNEDSKSAILHRKEGKNSLSWIENFCLYLFEDNCKPRVRFQDGGNEMVLVLRIRNILENPGGSHTGINTISANLCFFKTVGDSTRFCVNTACDENIEGLKDLMEDKANWADESTRNWWKEVFRDLKQPIDEDTLRRKEVLASDSLKMNMMDFIEKIQEIIGKAISKLNVDKQKISKVCIVEQYARALPFRYAINRMFPNAKGEVYPFVWKEKKMSWLQYASRFQVPGKLLHTTLLTSPQLTIGDILKLGENGVAITLPLSQNESGDYYVPSSPVIDNSDLKWKELMKEDVTPDYFVNNLAFKRVKISIFPDGFQEIYITCDTNVAAYSVFEQDKYNIKTLLLNKLGQTSKHTVSNTNQEKITKEGKSDSNITQVQPSLVVPSRISTESASAPIDSSCNDIADNDNSEIIKKGELNREIQDALTIIMALLRKKAYLFIRKNFPKDTAGNLYEKWINSKKKNGEDYPRDLKKNWERFKKIEAEKAKNKGKIYHWLSFNDPNFPESNTRMLDWGNYYVFLGQNWTKLRQDWETDIKRIEENIYDIGKLTRNDSSHQYVDDLSKDDLLNMLGYMIDIANRLNANDIKEKVNSVRTNVIKLLF